MPETFICENCCALIRNTEAWYDDDDDGTGESEGKAEESKMLPTKTALSTSTSSMAAVWRRV